MSWIFSIFFAVPSAVCALLLLADDRTSERHGTDMFGDEEWTSSHERLCVVAPVPSVLFFQAAEDVCPPFFVFVRDAVTTRHRRRLRRLHAAEVHVGDDHGVNHVDVAARDRRSDEAA